MEDLAIVCFSCDKNDEVWPVFYACLNKYWPNHPKTYLFTETKYYPLMKTINHDYPLDKWTTRIYKSLEDIPQNKIIFICDDCFLDEKVNIKKLQDCLNLLNKNNIAYINFELSFDSHDGDSIYKGFKKKMSDSSYRLSLLCGIWNKDKLMNILKYKEQSPWQLENSQYMNGYSSYQVTGDKVLSWFRDGPMMCGAKYSGKWSRDVVSFLEKEGLKMDLDKKGFNDK